jgi:large subunit ribosomal protein L11
MIIKLLVEAGNMKPSPAISQKLGPLGINMGKVIGEVNKATSQYAGLKVPVELDINTATKDFKVKVLTPPTSELLKKELGISKASMMPKSIYVGNLAIEQVINIAKKKDASNLKASVKTVLGTCVSCGILVESKNAKEVIKDLENGLYDALIKEAETKDLVVSKEKAEKLKADFAKVQASQEKLLREIQKAKEEKAAAKAAAAAPSATPSATSATTSTPSKEAKPAK